MMSSPPPPPKKKRKKKLYTLLYRCSSQVMVTLSKYLPKIVGLFLPNCMGKYTSPCNLQTWKKKSVYFILYLTAFLLQIVRKNLAIICAMISFSCINVIYSSTTIFSLIVCFFHLPSPKCISVNYPKRTVVQVFASLAHLCRANSGVTRNPARGGGGGAHQLILPKCAPERLVIILRPWGCMGGWVGGGGRSGPGTGVNTENCSS